MRNATYFASLKRESQQALEAFQNKRTKVKGFAQTYCLGSHEQIRVTIASQQVRGINLIDAIWKGREAAAYEAAAKVEATLANGFRGESLSLQGQRILIAGAGAAGLTAAAFAAQHGAAVTVIDRSTELLSRFRESDRLIDPRLYEWGAVQPYEVARADYWKSTSADIPLLSWQAGSARTVAQEISAEWTGWEAVYRIKRHTGVEIKAEGDGVSFRRVAGAAACPCGENCIAALDELRDCQTILILALGFGEEKTGSNDKPSAGYWARETEAEKLENLTGKKVLIEGNGDGAITDLLRLLVKGFTQHKLREWVERFDPDGALVEKVLKIELANWDRWRDEVSAKVESGETEFSSIPQAEGYWALECNGLDSIIRDGLRRDNGVFLSVRPAAPGGNADLTHAAVSALNSRAFPLNKLILASLIRVTAAETDNPLTVLVTPEGSEPDVVDVDVRLLRTGPQQEETQPVIGDKALRASLKLGSLRTEAAEWPSRRTQWAAIGERRGGDRATPAAWVMPFDRERLAVFEKMSASGFELITDLFDSTFQRALDDYAIANDKPDLVRNFFLGSLRTMMLFNHRILLTDAQLWDGRFMLALHKVFPKLSAGEQDLLKSKLVIRARTLDRPVRDMWSTQAAFSFSSMSSHLDRHMADFPGQPDETISERLSRLTKIQPQFAEEVELLTENWRKTDEWLQSTNIKKEPWPNASAWNVGLCYENPGQVYRSFADKSVILKAFAERPDAPGKNGARTPLHNFFNSQAASPQIEGLRDWFDRAYNRMTARSQGATVYLSLFAENVSLGDGSEESSTADLDKPLSIESIGSMPSEMFAEQHGQLAPRAEKWQRGGDVNIKREVFDELQSRVPEERADLDQADVSTNDHLVKKMRAFSTVEKLATTFIGRREAGPRNAALAHEVNLSNQEDKKEAVQEFTPRP